MDTQASSYWTDTDSAQWDRFGDSTVRVTRKRKR